MRISDWSSDVCSSDLSLTILPNILEILDKNTVKNITVVDVGSGAGLPGVVLAIMQPDWSVYCIDAVEKKMAFVRQMTGVLRLPNLQAVHKRVETLAPYPADIVVSRALADRKSRRLNSSH